MGKYQLLLIPCIFTVYVLSITAYIQIIIIITTIIISVGVLPQYFIYLFL
jgi:hypothetical protein